MQQNVASLTRFWSFLITPTQFSGTVRLVGNLIRLTLVNENGYYIMAGNSEEMELKDSAAPGSPQQNYDSLKELNANNGKHNNFLLFLRL